MQKFCIPSLFLLHVKISFSEKYIIHLHDIKGNFFPSYK